MKTILIALMGMLFCLPQTIFAQTQVSKSFYKKYKKEENTVNFSIPGWVIDVGAGIAKIAVDTEEEKAALKLLKKVQKMKFLVMEEGNRVSKNDVKLLVNKLQKNKHEPLISIRDGETNVQILLREKKDKLKNLTIIISEPDEFVFISLKTKIKMKDINQLMEMLDNDFDLNLLQEEEEDTEETTDDAPLIRA